jgi:hypothetical protein
MVISKIAGIVSSVIVSETIRSVFSPALASERIDVLISHESPRWSDASPITAVSVFSVGRLAAVVSGSLVIEPIPQPAETSDTRMPSIGDTVICLMRGKTPQSDLNGHFESPCDIQSLVAVANRTCIAPGCLRLVAPGQGRTCARCQADSGPAEASFCVGCGRPTHPAKRLCGKCLGTAIQNGETAECEEYVRCGICGKRIRKSMRSPHQCSMH